MGFHKDLRGLDLHSPSNEKVENTTGSPVSVLKVVKFTGLSSNGNPLVAVISSLSDLARGVMSETVANNATGNATTFGFLNDVDTSAWVAGTILFSDATGTLTTSTTTIRIGKVLKQNATTGVIYVDLALAPAGSGESNTASNVGVGGVGVFKQKTGVDLEFRNVNAASTKITVSSDVPNNEIDIDVSEANLTLDNIGGTLSISKGGTGQTAQTPAFDALAPATTKGDIVVYNGTDNIRLPVGTNTQVLTADSAEASGVKWAAGGGGGDTQVRLFYADQLDNPNSADWAVNALAPVAADSNNSGLTVRLFDDTTEEGVGFSLSVPSGKTNLILRLKSRAETAPGATQTVKLNLYVREAADNTAVEAWSAATQLTDLSIPTNENFQYDSQTIALSTLSITAGNFVQFELTRDSTDVGDTLVGDWALLEISAEFT